MEEITPPILTKEDLSELLWGESTDTLDFVTSTGWKDEGKYSYNTVVFKDPLNNYWGVEASRSGSYYDEYYYSYQDEIPVPYRVVQKEVTKTKWVPA